MIEKLFLRELKVEIMRMVLRGILVSLLIHYINICFFIRNRKISKNSSCS